MSDGSGRSMLRNTSNQYSTLGVNTANACSVMRSKARPTTRRDLKSVLDVILLANKGFRDADNNQRLKLGVQTWFWSMRGNLEALLSQAL